MIYITKTATMAISPICTSGLMEHQGVTLEAAGDARGHESWRRFGR